MMGKRRKTNIATSNNNANPSCSDNMPCSSGAELLTRKQSSHLHGSSELKQLSSGMDVTDRSMKLLHAHQHYNVGRSVFLKRSRHHFGHHYSRRNSGNYASASTSQGKNPSPQDEKLSFKLAGQSGSECEFHTENGGRSFDKPDEIKLSTLIVDASDSVKMICCICHKLLRRKAHFMEDAPTSGEYAIVAVLVCGHVYHADCLEQSTSPEEICDPPCPLCSGCLPWDRTSREQE